MREPPRNVQVAPYAWPLFHAGWELTRCFSPGASGLLLPQARPLSTKHKHAQKVGAVLLGECEVHGAIPCHGGGKRG